MNLRSQFSFRVRSLGPTCTASFRAGGATTRGGGYPSMASL